MPYKIIKKYCLLNNLFRVRKEVYKIYTLKKRMKLLKKFYHN